MEKMNDQIFVLLLAIILVSLAVNGSRAAKGLLIGAIVVGFTAGAVLILAGALKLL